MGKRIISRRRGAGTGRYRSPSHRHHGPIYHPGPSVVGEGRVVGIVMAPGRTAPVAEVQGPDGKVHRTLAMAGLATGDPVAFQRGAVGRGSILPLAEIPDGVERDRLFASHATKLPQFFTYQSRTARVIPVVTLRPIARNGSDR